MSSPSTQSVKAFISYSHDSREHKDRVLAVSDRLRSEGIDCNIDQYEDAPPEGWPRWMNDQIDAAHFVLVVCTEVYETRFRGHEAPGVGRGVTWEGAIVTQAVYNSIENMSKFIPVVFSSQDAKFVPAVLQGQSRYNVYDDEDYSRLYRRLTNQPLTPKPALGAVRPMSPKPRKQDFQSLDQESSGHLAAAEIESVPLDELRRLRHTVEALKQAMVDYATGHPVDEEHYGQLRADIIRSAVLSPLVPDVIKVFRHPNEFWGHITKESSTYAGRREYLARVFHALLTALEEAESHRMHSQSFGTDVITASSDSNHKVLTVAVMPTPQGFEAWCLDLGLHRLGTTVQDAVYTLSEEVEAYVMQFGLPSSDRAPVMTSLVLHPSETGLSSAAGPDVVGLTASRFVTAAYMRDVPSFWSLLSRESQGVWKGIWSTSEGDLGDLDLASQRPSSDRFRRLVGQIIDKLLSAWGPDYGKSDIGLAPTRYASPSRAQVRLVKGVTEPIFVSKPSQVPAIVVPLVREDGEWRIDYLSLITPLSLR